MLLILHIVIACISLFSSGVTVLMPSKTKVQFNYGLIIAVLVSGTGLVLQKPSHLPQACMSGIVYLSIVIFLLILAKRRLATLEV